MEFARHLLQVGEPAQRSGLATQAKPTSVGFKFLESAQGDEGLYSRDF